MLRSEKRILHYIKFTTIIFALTLSLLFIVFILYENYLHYKKDIRYNTKKFFDENRILIQNENIQIINLIKTYKKYYYENLDKQLEENTILITYIANILHNVHDYDKKTTVKKLNKLSKVIFKNKNLDFFIINEINSNFILSKDKSISKESILIKENDFYLLKGKYKCFYKYLKSYNIVFNTCKNIDIITKNIKNDLINNVLHITKNNSNYLFIIDNNERFIFHKNKSLLNKDIDNKTISLLIKTAKSKNKYITYSNFTNSNILKTSYLNEIKEFKWIIGIGFEHQSLNKEIELLKKYTEKESTKEVFYILIISFLLIILSLFTSLKISNILKNQILTYKNDLNKQISLRKEKELILIQKSKMSIMGEMIAYITHQWKQPLNRINGLNYLISMNIKDKETKEYLHEIENNTEYLNNTINYFSNFLKSNHKRIDFNVYSIIEQSLILLDSRIKQYKIEIDISNLQNTKIHAKEQEYIQVLLIILNNAIDNFIIQRTEKPKIIIISKQVNKTLILSIIDNGGGIYIKNINDIFNIWFTTKENNNGTGLGLYMAKFIIENSMSGKILVKVDKNNTIFKIYTKGKRYE